MPNSTSIKTLLTADIGGTHSRFALFSLDLAAPAPLESLALLRSVRFSTQSAANTSDMMRLLADTGLFPASSSAGESLVDAAVLAVPGPTSLADVTLPPLRNEVCHCPNIKWPMESEAVSGFLGQIPVRLINDFVANGFGCAFLPAVAETFPALPGTARPGFPQAVIGGGTGLGHCLILPGQKGVVLGSEGGHAIFPFTGEEEEIARYFRNALCIDGPVGDNVVTGSGLATLYAYYTGEKLHPFEAPARVAGHGEAFAMMARFYGRAVAHYAMSTLALGGVFITGGLAANLPGLLEHPEFAAELRERNAMRHILAPVPVWHVRNQALGLWGAAACASFLV